MKLRKIGFPHSPHFTRPVSEIDVRGRTPNNFISLAVSHEVGGDGRDKIILYGFVHVGMHQPQCQRQTFALQGTIAIFCDSRMRCLGRNGEKPTVVYLHTQIRHVVDSSQLLHSESSNHN